MQKYIDKIELKQSLNQNESEVAFGLIMDNKATTPQIMSLLKSLAKKGESADEIIGALNAIHKKSKKFPYDGKAIDVCGTGGDGKNSFNISTAVALLLATIGLKIIKHGNRSVSSSSGSADVLENLGINIQPDPKIMKKSLDNYNFAFLFAPLYHPAMRYAAEARRNLGIKTIFNIIGPMANPASPKFQLIGVYKKELIKLVAETLSKTKISRVWIAHSVDGMDEISTTSSNYICELESGEMKEFKINPEDYDLPKPNIKDLQIDNAKTSAKLMLELFAIETKYNNQLRCLADIICLNAAAGMMIYGKTSNMMDAIKLARQTMKSGKVIDTINRIAEITNAS